MTDRLAATTARRAAVSRSSPPASPAASAPLSVSPAPVASTALTARRRRCRPRGPSRGTRTAPAAPSETRIARPTPGPFAGRLEQGARGADRVLDARWSCDPERRASPVARPASSPRFGRQDVGEGEDRAVEAGRGRRVEHRGRAALAGQAEGRAGRGRSGSRGRRGRRRRARARGAPSASRTWASVTAALAPGATAIRFSPLASTRISATPVAVPVEAVDRRRCRTPWPASASSASSPNASSPSAATSATSRPEPRGGDGLVAALAAVEPAERAAEHGLAGLGQALARGRRGRR